MSPELFSQLAGSEHVERLRRAAARRLASDRRRALTTAHVVEPAELPAPPAPVTPGWWPALEAGRCLDTAPAPRRLPDDGAVAVVSVSAGSVDDDSVRVG